MKQQIFLKLTQAICFLILLTTFFVDENLSADFCLILKNKIDTTNYKDKHNLAENFDADEDEIFALVNEARQKHNLKVLVWDKQLSELARDYSARMARENFFDHFDSQGADIVVRAKKSNLRHWSKIGENLFSISRMRNFDSFAVENWMKSLTHRQNILDAEFNTAGIGIADSSDGEVFITQIFIRRERQIEIRHFAGRR